MCVSDRKLEAGIEFILPVLIKKYPKNMVFFVVL